MLKNHIINLITQELDYAPVQEQQELIGRLADFITPENLLNVFLVKGYAGTGKTTLVSGLVKVFEKLKIKSVLLAPTGRAAKVFSTYAGKNAYTIHKKIYRQKSSADAFGKFVLDKNFNTNTFFIVDEASMLPDQSKETSIFGSGRLLDDLIEYVFSGQGSKLILIGDTAQLPPVGLIISPALKKEVLTGYKLNVEEFILTEVIRQSNDSGILFNATSVRNMISANEIYFPKIKTNSYTDIHRISGSELIELISSAYDKNGREQTIVITRSNKRANKYNEGIRKQILWKEEQISQGDFLMVVKNNYYWLPENEISNFIANGDIIEIVHVENFCERYGFHFADAVVRLVDFEAQEFHVKMLLDTLVAESPSLTLEENKKLFFAVAEDYVDIKSKKQRFEEVKVDPFFNALQIKFAYAVTCHKAQGGQWKTVFIDQGYITQEMLNIEYLRWLYTALTRAVEKLYLVNFSREFFDVAEHTDYFL
ncbi:MAG: AAA family ATPase [Bacteroidia bacterium]|nr:AAA family ATPase [Bacteroidia bacterium]